MQLYQVYSITQQNTHYIHAVHINSLRAKKWKHSVIFLMIIILVFLILSIFPEISLVTLCTDVTGNKNDHSYVKRRSDVRNTEHTSIKDAKWKSIAICLSKTQQCCAGRKGAVLPCRVKCRNGRIMSFYCFQILVPEESITLLVSYPHYNNPSSRHEVIGL